MQAEAARSTAARIVPVGMPLGVEHAAEDGHPDTGMVRCGGRFWRIPLPGYELWLRVRVDGTRDDVGAWAREQGIEDSDAVLDWLQDNGLIVCLRGDLSSDASVIRSCRLVPTAMGGGDTPDRPGTYRIVGHDGSDLLSLDRSTYLTWAYANGCMSIADVIGVVSRQFSTPLRTVYEWVWLGLVRLVQVGAAVVDRTIEPC
jgi:hypothetical protein